MLYHIAILRYIDTYRTSLVMITRDFSIDRVSSAKKFDRFLETAAVRVNGLKYYGNTLYYNSQAVSL